MHHGNQHTRQMRVPVPLNLIIAHDVTSAFQTNIYVPCNMYVIAFTSSPYHSFPVHGRRERVDRDIFQD